MSQQLSDHLQVVLGVEPEFLDRLRALLPRSKHYALGARPGEVALIEPWRILLPPQAVETGFQGI